MSETKYKVGSPALWNTAYPGSMSEKSNGSYVRADDESSLATSLLVMIAKLKEENAQYKHDYTAPYIVDELREKVVAGEKAIEACRGWKKLHDEMIALGGDVKSLTSEQIAQFACDQALLINLTDSALSALPAEETK